MPKPTESMDVNQYTRHKSYAYHNNLHHDAHRSTGPVLSVFGAEPRSASAPAQHEGEGILALLDPREPPCHYFAVVTQEFLTLSPLMMKGAVVSKKAYGSRKYSGVEGSTKLDMKLVNSAKDEVARALATTANVCLEEMKTAEEQGVEAARRSSRAVARKVKEKALAASDSAERLHQAMLDKKAGRRASSTVATPKTAAVVDTRLRRALNPAAVAPDAPSVSSVAADDARASPLLCALVERCISLGLSISRTGPSLPSPSKRARARQVTAVGDLRSPRAGDRSSRGATEPALALLACSHLLLGLLQASYVMREIAASECADEVDDFLLRDEFYDALEANRVTRLAASNLREATRVIRQGEETAKAAHRKQRGGDITHA